MSRPWAGALYLALLTVSVLLGYLARVYPVFPGDQELARGVRSLDGEALRLLLVAVSALGDWWLALLPPLAIAGLLAALKQRREAAFLLAAAFPLGINEAIKLLVARPRPEGWAGPTSSSFPSGHAVHSVAFYGFLFYLTSVLVQPRWLRRALQVLLLGFILETGLSRIYLGAHWPSDVLGGYLVGGAMLIPLVWAYRRR